MAANPRLQWLRAPSRGGTPKNASRSSFNSATASPAPATPSIFSTHTAVKDTTGKTTEYRNEDDICPVCKSDRFLNPKLRLLVSSCYHRMCESCIDRLFTLGPAPCPICQTVLRKMAFIPQTFEDLGVEKEVSVRRRMAKEFNKRREDFPDLRTYNDYLEQVEDITFNLIHGIDVAATEARIVAYRHENAALIELNIQRDERDVSSLHEEESRARKERLERAEEQRREEEDERLEREREKTDIIDSLQKSEADPDRVVAKARADAAKRAHFKKPLDVSSTYRRTGARSTIKAADEPHVPFDDDWSMSDDKFVLRKEYYDPASDMVNADSDGRVRAGGYRVDEVWMRALSCAVMGLDIAPLENGSPLRQDIVSQAT